MRLRTVPPKLRQVILSAAPGQASGVSATLSASSGLEASPSCAVTVTTVPGSPS